MEETGGQALRRREVVAGRRHSPEMHGAQTSHLVLGGISDSLPKKNITAFLMNQNRQFDDVINGLTYARNSLDGARYDALSPQLNHAPICALVDNRLRNHDLLTSLDVLTTGSYRRLPTIIKVWTFTQATRQELKMTTEIHHTTSSTY